ncbi:hypothetical protein LGN37_24585, partial [Escherichia coli]|nr:hypothetical protein [Escherichia coli]MCA8558467.1 hypothetical protein [Escherichia coli]
MSTVYHRPADPSGDDSYVRPLFADRCQAGFPSPATDYAEQEPRQPGGCKLKTAPVRPVVAARPAE